MEIKRQKDTHSVEHPDTSVITSFPPGFFQKGLAHILKHSDEEFSLQFTENKVFLRRMKKQINGQRPQSLTNGQIIAWCNYQPKSVTI